MEDLDPDSELFEFEAGVDRALAHIAAPKITPRELTDAILRGSSPPPVSPGGLRPYVPPYDPRTASWEYKGVLDRALRLLLFTPEVIVDDPAPFLSFEPRAFAETASVLSLIEDIWDLVEDGSLLMGDMNIMPGWEPLERDSAVGLGFTEDEHTHWDYQIMALEYWPQRTTPWFLPGKQYRAAESLFHMASASTGADRRALQLPKLATLDLPSLRLHTADLVAVRKSSETFGEWRRQLGAALAQVELLPDNEGWQREAQAIVADELAPYAERVRAEAAKSTALAASMVGMKQMGIAGIGSAGAAFTAGPAGALGALGATALATLVSGLSDWAKARRDAAPERAVLQLALVFDNPS